MVHLEGVECGPHKTVIQTNHGNPYYVKLHRCQGGNSNVNRKTCRMTEFDTLWYWEHTNGEFVEISNHTKCDYQCRENKTSCESEEMWNLDTCTCHCRRNIKSCPPSFHWEKIHCRCMLDQFPKESSHGGEYLKQCGNMVDVSLVYLIGSLEFFIVISICCVVFNYYCKRRHGGVPNGPQQVPLNSTNLKSDNDSHEQ